MIMKTEVTLDPKETGGSLFDRLAEEGAKLCVETVAAIEAGTATYTPQDHEAATLTRMIKKQLGDIDWTKSAREIECLIRGLNPWPSAYTKLGGKTLKIWDAEVVEVDAQAQPGVITKVGKKEVYVQTGDGQLSLKEVQLEGKKRMEIDAFLRGCQVSEGEVL